MLKKCIAFAVVFAVAAGAAFAQVTFGGQLQTSAVFLSGDNVTDSDINMGGAYNGTYTNAKFTALIGDGTAGGRIVLDQLNSGTRFWGWMQWRPSQYFRIKVGRDEDGDSVIGGFPQITGWGFTGEAKNAAAVSDYNGSLAMNYRNAGLNYGAFDNAGGFSLGLSFFPIDDLTVSLLFKANFDEAVEVSERLATTHLVVGYKIEEVGMIRFAAQGNGGLKSEADEGADIATLWLAFYSNEIVQGLAFEVGGNFNLPHKPVETKTDEKTGKVTEGYTDMGAIHASAGINLTATDPFNLKIRVGSEFGGQSKGKDIEKVGFSVGLLPSYKLPKMTIFFHAGFGYEQTGSEDAKTNWFINPYVWVPMGGMRMWIGVQVVDEGKRSADDAQQLSWRIPFGFNFYF
jgi:hypothetical protein